MKFNFFCTMQTTILFVFSALVALAIFLSSCSAEKPLNENKVDLIYIVDLLGSITVIDQDIIESVLEKKILPEGKKVTIYGRELSTENIIKLFKQLSKINWKTTRPLLEQYAISKHKHSHIDEKKVLMPDIIQLAERFSKANWKTFISSFDSKPPRDLPPRPNKVKQLDWSQFESSLKNNKQ